MKQSWQQVESEILGRLDIAAEYRALSVDVLDRESNAEGWVCCRAFGREDRNPSAAVNVRTGRYKDFGGEGVSVSLWDFACQFGPFSTWQEARKHYAAKAGVKLPRGRPPIDPAEHLRFQRWNETLVALWCRHKPGVTPEAVRAAGGRLARYRDQWMVVALPVFGAGGVEVDPVGWVLFQTNGQFLPVFRKGGSPQWVKVKTTAGSQGGLLGAWALSRLANQVAGQANAAEQIIWKTAGPSDLLALWAAIPPNLRGSHLVLSNAFGEVESPTPAITKRFEGWKVRVLHDADTAGEAGAERWTRALAKVAAEVRHVRLPYPVEKSHGKDVRDFLTEGHTYENLLALADQAEPIQADQRPAADLSNGLEEEVQNESGEAKTEVIPLTMRELLADILERTGDWPRRVQTALFIDAKPGVHWLERPPALFGYLSDRCGLVKWHGGVGFVKQAEVFEELRRQATPYVAIEEQPHEPRIEGHYYACDFPEPGDGSTLDKLLDFFALETPLDRELLATAYATPLWGGPAGGRPAFMFVAAGGRGKGKSIAAQSIGRLYGECIDITPNEDAAVIKTRLLTPEALPKRVALLDNVKTMRFSWAELEKLITIKVVSGRRLYVGESSRPNYLTWAITLNGASLSTDMAQRVVEIRLAEPEYMAGWERKLGAFIDGNRDAILGDLIGFLRRKPNPVGPQGRWAEWEANVLARVSHPADCQKLISERRKTVDAECEEGETLEDYFASRLEWLGYNPTRDDVFIPNAIVVRWYNQALNENRKTTGATRALRQLFDEGRIERIIQARAGPGGERGFRWVGPAADAADVTWHDIRQRIARKFQDGKTREDSETHEGREF